MMSPKLDEAYVKYREVYTALTQEQDARKLSAAHLKKVQGEVLGSFDASHSHV